MDRTAPSRSSFGLFSASRVGEQEVAGGKRQRHDRHVDEEHRAPGEVAEQPAAEQRSRTRRQCPTRRPICRSRWARSLRSVNRLVSKDKVAGMISAPPMPMNDRVAISIEADVANADATEPVTKISRPADSAERRPNRSPMLPAVSNRPAKTSVYPSRIHCSWLVEACRSSERRGSATFRMVLSRLTTVRLRHNTASPSHRRSKVLCASMTYIQYRLVPKLNRSEYAMCHVARAGLSSRCAFGRW